MIATLTSGAAMRRTGPADGLPVVCVNGGTGRVQPGDWSGSLEWLVQRLAPDFPAIAFHEVRYRVKSWKRLDLCIEDARAALDEVEDPGGRHTLMIGVSMGGAVSIGCADHPSVAAVVGLAPWIPPAMEVGTLVGKRLTVIHGSLDGGLPGIPGVSPRSSRAGVERAAAAGVETSYSLIRGAVHPIAVRWRGGRPLPLPRADIIKLFGDEKWALLDLECELPDGRVVTLAGWENRYWIIRGLPAPDALLPALLQKTLALTRERSAVITPLVQQWQETGAHLSVMPDGELKLAGLLRSRSRVYLGLEPQNWKDIRLRRIPPNANDGPVTRVTLFKILPLTAALYDQLALGAALLFVLAALLFAALATLAWKNHWPLAGVLCALGFVFTALYGLRLAGARED